MSHRSWRQKVSRRAQLEACEPRTLMTADPVLNLHVDYTVERAPGTITPELQAALEATSVNTLANTYGYTGAGQTVAIIDSGIAYDHPALGGGFGSSYRVVGGWDFAENDANPYDDGPGGSHGTHVAGIVGSSDATYSGVAPGVDLVSLRVFNDQGSGSFDWVEQALRWVHQHRNDFENPITTVNLSIGTSWNSDNVPSWAMLEDEFAQLKADGIFISVAAGNSFSTYNATGLSYPAASSYVVPVASVDADGSLSSYSQRNDRVIAAPGRSIRSTVPDYVGNFNGRTDDWATYSGTSMAAPYVAGASVLIRQALMASGTQNVNEDMIYNVMRQTADSIYDPATSRSYTRLNLQRALSSIASADDYGSSVQTAYSLGSVSSTSVNGRIERSGDQDFFTFTAAQSGTCSFVATTTGNWPASWTLSGATADSGSSGNTLSFAVTAGATYSVGIGGGSNTGSYSLAMNVVRPATSLGTISASLAADQVVAGESWYSFTAARSGVVTAEALFQSVGGSVSLELYNGARQLIATGSTSSTGRRLDVTATGGDVFYVRLRGTNSDVDLRLTNLVNIALGTVTVSGTEGNDTFSFRADTRSFIINGVSYSASSASRFVFTGGGGQDSATLTGSSSNETATLRPGAVDLVGPKYQISLSETENIVVQAGSGTDRAMLYDSTGDDVFTANPTSATLVGAGYSLRVDSFDKVEARASTGNDTATLDDSRGNDTLLASPTSSVLYGRGFYNGAYSFDSVVARASAGGTDAAYFTDSSGDDTFITNAAYATMFGAGYCNTAQNFERVKASASQGGHDQALMQDTSGNDRLSVRRSTATLSGGGVSQSVTGFGQVQAEGTTGTNQLDRGAIDFVFDEVGSWS